jgi:hypothetical protein
MAARVKPRRKRHPPISHDHDTGLDEEQREESTPESEEQEPEFKAKAEKIEQLLADRFRARWKAVEAEFADGIDVARRRASCFFGSDSGRLRTARHYYNPARATKFATSSDDEIVNLCWAWFIPFQIYAYNETVFDGIDELGDQLESLVAEEYVAMTWGLFDNRAEYSDWDPSDPYSIEALGCYASPTLSPLHFECDAYETIALAETGNYLRICKSVPGPFHKVERIRAMDEIEEQFLKSASNEGADPTTFRLDFRRPEYSRKFIEVDIIDGDSSYQKQIHRELTAQLKATGAGYIKRPPPDLRWYYEPDPRKPVRKSR